MQIGMKKLWIVLFVMSASLCFSQKQAIDSKDKFDAKTLSPLKSDSFMIIYPGNWQNATNALLYTTPEGLYVNGSNEYDDIAKAQVFNATEEYNIVGAYFWIGAIDGMAGQVNFNVWNFEGEPTNVLSYTTISVSDLQAQVNTEDFFYVEFDMPVRHTGMFAVGIDLYDIEDSEIGLVSTADGQGTGQELVWEQWFDSRWYSYLDVNSWNFDIDLGIFPVICIDVPVVIEDFEDGTGTSDDPFLIANEEQLDKVRNYPDKHYKLINDLDIGVYTQNKEAGWNGIASTPEAFTGSFDGNGHMINGLRIGKSSLDYKGLFSVVQNASISDLYLSNVDVSGHRYVGALAGKLDNSVVDNVKVIGDVSGVSYTGGLFGIVSDQSEITRSSFQGIIHGQKFTGGLAGLIDTESSVSESYTMGTVNGDDYTGGFIGELSAKTPKSIVTDHGVSLVLPPGVNLDESNFSLTEYQGDDLTFDGELLMSPAVTINISTPGVEIIVEELIAGDRSPLYEIRFPLSESDLEEDRLRARVRIDEETLLPVFGNYDPTTQSYTIYTQGLHDGWKVGVISGEPVTSVSSIFETPSSDKSNKSWTSFKFKIKDDSRYQNQADAITDQEILTNIDPIARDILNTYYKLGFAAPHLNTDSDNEFKMSLINYNPGQPSTVSGANGESFYQAPQTSNDLGGVYIFHPDYIGDHTRPESYDLKYVLAHEIFHSIQSGYQKNYTLVKSKYFGPDSEISSVTCYEEGSADLVGETYKQTGGLNSGSVYVHPGSATSVQPPMNFAFPFDDYNYDPYLKQDLFAFISKKYFSGSLTYLNDLWRSFPEPEYVSTEQVLIDYRKGFDNFLKSNGYSLPWAFTEFALQRLIIHDQEYLLRDSEKSDDTYKPFTLTNKLLAEGSEKTNYKKWESNRTDILIYEPVVINDIKSFTAAGIDFYLPEDMDEADRPDSLFFEIMLSGTVKLEPAIDQEGVRIIVYRKKGKDLVQTEPTLLIDDIDKQVAVSLDDDVDNLSFVIVNAHMEMISTDLSINLKLVGEVLNETLNKKYITIQEAVNEARDGDNIIVFPGTYLESVNLLNKSISIESQAGPNTTFIDGSESTTIRVGLYNAASSDIDASISGFSFTNWEAAVGCYNLAEANANLNLDNNIFSDNTETVIYYQGCDGEITNNTLISNGNDDDFEPGIYLSSKSSAIVKDNAITEQKGSGIEVDGPAWIENNIIAYNNAQSGGGIRVSKSSATIINNDIHHNTANFGGGISVHESTADIRSNKINDNKSMIGSGGGISVSSPSDNVTNTTIRTNEISRNYSAQDGGGIDCFWCGGQIINNTISENEARLGGGLNVHQGATIISGNTFMKNHARDTGGAISGFNILSWPKTEKIIDDNGYEYTVHRHTPCFPEPTNTYINNTHVNTFESWGPGTNNWCTDSGYNVHMR